MKIRNNRWKIDAAQWLVIGLIGLVPLGVMAAPPSPRTPGVLFFEDFENRDDKGSALPLPSYVGAAAAKGSQYTAEGYWLQTSQCNGLVLDSTNPAPTCNAKGETFVQRMALSMGTFHGRSSPEKETVLSAFTQDFAGPAHAIQFQTRNSIDFPVGRFVTFGVDSINYYPEDASFRSNRECLAPAQLKFYLVDSSNVEQSLNADALDSCTGNFTQQQWGRVKSIAATNPIITTVGNARLRMRNDTSATDGNDAAVDNFLLQDVTPELHKEFSKGPLPNNAHGVNKIARLVFTVVNRTDYLEKKGWGFTDTLPLGLVIAPFTGAYTCGGTVVATPGTNTISVTEGIMRAGSQNATCTIEVNVTAAQPGTYVNGADRLGNVVGLDAPVNASVTFIEQPTIQIQKILGGTRVDPSDQFRLLAAAGAQVGAASTTGSGADISSPPLQYDAVPGVPYTLAETLVSDPSGNEIISARYSTNWRCLNRTQNGTQIPPTGIGTAFSLPRLVGTDRIECTVTNTPRSTDLAVVKTAARAAVQSGDELEYTLTVTNAGPAAANGAVLTDVAGAGLNCGLASAASKNVCTASGSAACPNVSGVDLGQALFGAGLSLPLLPAQGQIDIKVFCQVTATGQ
ncbi:MAG: DUF11 domain-containing protein [Comamonadaceae bacterium]|nr:MAG: DUF11 domain-containing protein [Comamonadaceae bacterium]